MPLRLWKKKIPFYRHPKKEKGKTLTMKTLLMGEHTELPMVLRHMLKLRHGQLIFKGIWNGTVGENSVILQAVIQVHDHPPYGFAVP